MIVAGLVLWAIVIFIKLKSIKSLISEIKTSSESKFKTIGLYIAKNPYFVFIVVGFLSIIIFDRKTRILEAFVVAPVSYVMPIAIFLFITHKKNTTSNSDKEHIRGAALANEDSLSVAIAGMLNDKSLPITHKISIPNQFETTHFFTIGRPGCGKSQLFYRIISKVLERGDKAVIYDFKGDQVSKFFKSEKHILFNPLDKRCVQWCLFNEIETPLDIKSIAASLIPITGNDPYWSNAARDVFCGILTALYHAGERTNAAVFEWCNLSSADLLQRLARYPGTETATKHLAQEKQAASVLSIMGTTTQCFEYLKNINGQFSIKKWATDDNDRRCVFLTNYSEISDTIRPILSLFVELTGKRVLSLPDNRDRRFFFFIDEFGTLNNLPTIPIMLTNGRSKGMSIWIAIQDVGQIEKIYGRDIAQTVINSCATSFIFAVNDPTTADFISRKIGEREVRQTNVSSSNSTPSGFLSKQEGSTSTSVSYQTLNERVLLPSELMNLPNLYLLLKMPDFNVTPLQLPIVSIPDVEKAFVSRDDIKLDVQTTEPEQTNDPKETSVPDEFHL